MYHLRSARITTEDVLPHVKRRIRTIQQPCSQYMIPRRFHLWHLISHKCGHGITERYPELQDPMSDLIV